MNIIRPTLITDAMFLSSDVPETDYPEFAMATTYALGTRVIDSTGAEILNIDVAPAADWAAGDLITGQTSAKTARVVDKLTTYSYRIRERSGDFTLGEIIGVTGVGAKLADQGAAHPTVTPAADKVHKIYDSIADGNTGNYPPADLLLTPPLWWKEIGATSRWKPFDGKNGSQCCQAELITYSLKPGIIDSISFQNLDATLITVTMMNPAGTWDDIEDFDLVSDVDGLLSVVYNQEIDLISNDGIIDGWTYCFEPIIQKTETWKLNLPPYSAAVLNITIANPGGIAKVGEIVMGQQRDIGQSLFSMSAGIRDYSQKSPDAEGAYRFIPGPYAKKYSVTLQVPENLVDEVYRLLCLYRATPLVWIATSTLSTYHAYGIYTNFDMELSGPLRGHCRLDIDGLT